MSGTTPFLEHTRTLTSGSLPTSINLEEQTPLMRQYWELKNQVGDALLLFRMGDFYELFGDDAVQASEILEITLTSRDKNKPNPLPMAGVPHHSISGYIQRLLKAGKKIAIGEQVEDADTVKAGKIVRREITRVLTPGVQFEAEGSEANYLATLTQMESQELYVLTCLDASTGEVLISQPTPLPTLAMDCQRLPIRHFLFMSLEDRLSELHLPANLLVETLPKNYLSQERARELLKKHYQIEAIDSFFSSPAGALGLGILLTYVLKAQYQENLAHLQLPTPLHEPQSLQLGPNSSHHLDLDELFEFINRAKSTLGSRTLKRWMLSPLNRSQAIHQRQQGVQELSRQWKRFGEKTSQALAHVYDLERICGRVNTQLANPKDSLALGQSLSSLSSLAEHLKPAESPLLQEIHHRITELANQLNPLTQRVLNSQKEDAPVSMKDGGIFKKGTTPELDRLISLTEEGQKWLIDLETRERESTGISSLKVRYNRVFGYYIEVTQAHLKSVPAHYQRKQTMVGAERFFTEELKKFEEEILTASVKQKSLEQELFQLLLAEIKTHTAAIMNAAKTLGELDSLCSLSQLQGHAGWAFPIIDESYELEIQAGRHPVVDQAKRGQFVPNDLTLSPSSRLTLLITGPNMGGKSTVMRQTALIVLLGQMGAPVPARSARWGVFSSIYTRIGAQDAISKGQSTFMVEMSELAHILHSADDRSLIILDEIGRGTSTYDGMSVAWATLEWICSRIQARTLFATHYHELIKLAQSLPRLANAHMAVENEKQGSNPTLRFLYELREGPTNESFGIHVAQLAGLPKPVIERAWKVLEDLESAPQDRDTRAQLSLFQPISAPLTSPSVSERQWKVEEKAAPTEVIRFAPHPILGELQEIEPNTTTPLEALSILARLKTLLKETPMT